MAPSKHPRIAVTVDDDLSAALSRVRHITGTDEPDATLVRRLAISGAETEVAEREEHSRNVHAYFEGVRARGGGMTMEEIDRLNGFEWPDGPWPDDPGLKK